MVETMDNSKRGLNLEAMTIIKSRKEYLPSRESYQRPSVLKARALSIEPHGSGMSFFEGSIDQGHTARK